MPAERYFSGALRQLLLQWNKPRTNADYADRYGLTRTDVDRFSIRDYLFNPRYERFDSLLPAPVIVY